MKKRLFFAIAVCTSIAYTNAQVGINTTDPKTTLHVIGTNDNGAVAATDGVLVPRVNALAVNGTEDGQLVYLIADAGTFDKGFHFWNATNSAWEPIADAEAIAGTAEIRKVAGNNIISSEAGSTVGVAISAGATNEDNIVIGRGAGGAQTSGQKNVILGSLAGATTAAPGNNNVYIGPSAGRETTTNGGNVALGSSSLRSIKGSAGSNSIAIGSSALNGVTANGNDNTAIGRLSGRVATLTSNNLILGTGAAENATAISSNIIMGNAAVSGGTIGSENIMVGRSNSASITNAGNQNTAIGNYQLRGATIGASNISLGPNVFDNATVASHNIAIGNSSGSGITAGTGNIMFGQNVADGQTVGDNNIAIGGLIDFHATGASASNQLNIQNIIFGTDNSGAGTNISTAGKIGIGQPAPTERLDVAGTTKANNFRQNIEATTTIDKTKGIILANANFSIPAATDYTGLTITVRNIGTTGITFNAGNRNINGVSTNTRTIPVGNTFRFTSDGTNWYIISQL